MNPRSTLLAAAASVLVGGCDVPTEPPLVEQRWIVPVDRTSLPVDDLLPSSVSTSGDEFDVSVDPVMADETLGNICGDPCRSADGLVVPLPEFEGSYQAEEPLPADVRSAEVTGGSVEVEITNGFSFDPIENGGTVRITFSDAATGSELAEVVFDGTTEALPPGATKTRTVPLSPGSVSEGLRATVSFHVAGGQTARIDVDEVVEVTATATSLQVASITVDVGDRPVSFEEVELDLAEVDAGIADRISEGSIVLDVTNPLAVAVDGSVEIGATSKAFSISGDGESTVALPYSGDELRSIVGEPDMTFSGSGIANGTAVTIRPEQEITIDATLDFTLEIGGGDGS